MCVYVYNYTPHTHIQTHIHTFLCMYVQSYVVYMSVFKECLLPNFSFWKPLECVSITLKRGATCIDKPGDLDDILFTLFSPVQWDFRKGASSRSYIYRPTVLGVEVSDTNLFKSGRKFYFNSLFRMLIKLVFIRSSYKLG